MEKSERSLGDGAIVAALAAGIPTGMDHALGGFFQMMNGSAVGAAARFLCAWEERAAIRH